MFGFLKRNSRETRYVRTVSVSYGHDSKEYQVQESGERWLVRLYDRWMVLKPSTDGSVARAMQPDGTFCWYFPLRGWTNTDLRKYGFKAPDDGIVPEEIALARAVISGDKAAALALADWVVENWRK